MDVLVVVGTEPAPTRLEDRALHVHRFRTDEALATLVGALRARIPRRVGVWGPVAESAPVAAGLRRAGLPTELFTDERVPDDAVATLTGVEIRRVTDAGPPMDVADTLVELIGNTPMVRLDRTARDLECTLVAKLELFNPGGSSKDRIALAMIRGGGGGRPAPAGRDHRRAHQWEHRRGARHRGGAARLQLHLRLPRQGGAREDRPAARLRRRGRGVSHLRGTRTPRIVLLGARTAWPARCRWRGSPTSTTTPTIPQAQHDTTGAEIWEQTRGRVTHFVAGIGTGGTVTGIGRYLKEHNPAVQIIGADPDGSVYSGGSGPALSGGGHRRGLLARRPTTPRSWTGWGGDLRRGELRPRRVA